MIGDLGGVAALATTVERVLHALGAETCVIAHPDGSAQAQEANALDAELYIGLGISTEARCAFYATSGFWSEGGQRLATLLADELGRPELALDQIAVDRHAAARPARDPDAGRGVRAGPGPRRRRAGRRSWPSGSALAVGAWVADPLPAQI